MVNYILYIVYLSIAKTFILKFAVLIIILQGHYINDYFLHNKTSKIAKLRSNY